MMMNFDAFNSSVNMDSINAQIHEIEKANAITDVPAGVYSCKIEKMQARVSKNAKPYISVWFRIQGGSFVRKVLFYNGFYSTPRNKLETAKFLNSVYYSDADQTANFFVMLDTANSSELQASLNEMCQDVGGLTYEINYSVAADGFSKFSILRVDEL